MSINRAVLTNEIKKKPYGQSQHTHKMKTQHTKTYRVQKKASREVTVINTPPRRRKVSNSTPGGNEEKKTRKSGEGKKSRLQLK